MSINSAGVEATRFHSATTGFGGNVFGSFTMFDVLQGVAGGDHLATLGRYIVAAMLNAKAGLSPFLDENTVRQMWNDVVTNGHYEPLPGVHWGSEQIVAYLRSIMT